MIFKLRTKLLVQCYFVRHIDDKELLIVIIRISENV